MITGKNRDKNLVILTNRINNTFMILNEVKLIRYIKRSHQVNTTELSRIACNYYMSYKSIDKFNKSLVEDMTEKSFKYENLRRRKKSINWVNRKNNTIKKNE